MGARPLASINLDQQFQPRGGYLAGDVERVLQSQTYQKFDGRRGSTACFGRVVHSSSPNFSTFNVAGTISFLSKTSL
jgi:hypothetical protein